MGALTQIFTSPYGTSTRYWPHASGSYCAQECWYDDECLAGTTRTTPKCTMSQGQATKYCEYTCETDNDCPEQATCEFNIASRICTYNSGYNTPVPSAPSPTP